MVWSATGRSGTAAAGGVIRASWLHRPHPLADHPLQLDGVDRLGQEVVHPDGQTALALALQRGGGHRDDRHPALARLDPTDLPGGVVPVHPRHPAVHQHGGVLVRPGQPLDRLDAVVGDVDGAAHVLEQPGRDHLVDRVVLDDEHPGAEAGPVRPIGGGYDGRRADHRHQGVAQLGVPHRLAQPGPDAGGVDVASGDRLLGGEQHHRQPRQRGVVAHLAGQPEAVGARHHLVEQCGVEGLARLGRLAESGQRVVGRGDRHRPRVPGRQLLLEDEPVGLVVVDDEHPATGQVVDRVRGADAQRHRRCRAAP